MWTVAKQNIGVEVVHYPSTPSSALAVVKVNGNSPKFGGPLAPPKK